MHEVYHIFRDIVAVPTQQCMRQRTTADLRSGKRKLKVDRLGHHGKVINTHRVRQNTPNGTNMVKLKSIM